MADGRYGRLFTEADIRNAMLWAHIRGWQAGRHGTAVGAASSEVLLREFEEGGEEFGERLTFPADEPLFLLRGQDAYALDAVRCYAFEASRQGFAPHAAAAHEALHALEDWQVANPDRVKVPD